MSNTRRSFIEMVYRGVNVTKEISKDLISVSYTDNENGKADKIAVTLKDERSKWLNNWRPQKGDTIDLLMLTTNWRRQGDAQQLDCGRFKVDTVKHNGPPTRVVIEASSVDTTSSFRSRVKNRTWSEIGLKELAQQIAEANDLTLYFDSTENPFVTQSEQTGVSDARYLSMQAAKYGFGMKMFKDQIIMYRVEDLDNRAGRLTIDKSDFTKWDLQSSNTSVVEQVIVGYYDIAGDVLVQSEFTGPPQPNRGNGGIQLLPGETFTVLIPPTVETNEGTERLQGPPKPVRLNQPVYSVKEAERVAKSEYIRRNKQSVVLKITVPLTLAGTVGVNAYITGLATYDGKYSIEKAKHTIGGSSKSDFELKRTVVV